MKNITIMLMTDGEHYIKAKIFKQELSTLGSIIKENKVYKLQKFNVNSVQKKYQSIVVPANKEIVCNKFTKVFLMNDSLVPAVTRKYTTIDEWINTEPSTLVGNICAVIINKPKATKRTINTNTYLMMDLVLLDQTNASCCFTLWNENATKFDHKCHPGDMIKIHDVYNKLMKERIYIISVDVSKISITRQSTSKTLISELREVQKFWNTHHTEIIQQYNQHELSTSTKETPFFFEPPEIKTEDTTTEATTTAAVTAPIPRKRNNKDERTAKSPKKKQKKESPQHQKTSSITA